MIKVSRTFGQGILRCHIRSKGVSDIEDAETLLSIILVANFTGKLLNSLT